MAATTPVRIRVASDFLIFISNSFVKVCRRWSQQTIHKKPKRKWYQFQVMTKTLLPLSVLTSSLLSTKMHFCRAKGYQPCADPNHRHPLLSLPARRFKLARAPPTFFCTRSYQYWRRPNASWTITDGLDAKIQSCNRAIL